MSLVKKVSKTESAFAVVLLSLRQYASSKTLVSKQLLQGLLSLRTYLLQGFIKGK